MLSVNYKSNTCYSFSLFQGVERLSACTDNGKLKFFDLETMSNRRSSWVNPDLPDGSLLNGEGSACKKAKMDEDMVDHPGMVYLCSETYPKLIGFTIFQFVA